MITNQFNIFLDYPWYANHCACWMYVNVKMDPTHRKLSEAVVREYVCISGDYCRRRVWSKWHRVSVSQRTNNLTLVSALYQMLSSSLLFASVIFLLESVLAAGAYLS